jgi:uncharacterized membrane protein
MQLVILITGILASLFFFLSGISYFLKWGNFKSIALAFLAAAITMFILMIIRHVREEWEIGGNKKGG